MEKQKRTVPFEIETDQDAWLEKVTDDYSLQDKSKAVRVLLDYAMQDGDLGEIFETIRCRRC